MKNRNNNEMDGELRKKVEGLTRSQIELLADIYAGMAAQLTRKRAADSMAKWKPRHDWSRN